MIAILGNSITKEVYNKLRNSVNMHSLVVNIYMNKMVCVLGLMKICCPQSLIIYQNLVLDEGQGLLSNDDGSGF